MLCSSFVRERNKWCPLTAHLRYLPVSNPPGFAQISQPFCFPFSFFFFGIDLFYSKSACHLTFKFEVSMVQQLPKPLPSCNYRTALQICLASNLRQEVLQIYCSCFFINCQQLQLLEFESHQYSKDTLRAAWKWERSGTVKGQDTAGYSARVCLYDSWCCNSPVVAKFLEPP